MNSLTLSASKQQMLETNNLLSTDFVSQHTLPLSSGNKKSSDSMQQSLLLVDDCEEKGLSIIDELQRQRDKISSVSDKINVVDDNMNTAERLLRGISSIGGAIINKFTIDTSYINNNPRPENTPHNRPENISYKPMDYFDETDVYLEQLGNKVELLNMMSMEIHQEIEEQNKILDKLGENIDKENKHLNRVNSRLRTI